ncbi:hypothetical protein J4463_03945, partial [Candidatus Pacearchaeota archaeon]|nr:hypothetical protein [Candidatus Pacearchaeota archaeon]
HRFCPAEKKTRLRQNQDDRQDNGTEQIKMFEEIKRRFVSGRPLNMRGMMDDLYVQVELLNAGINGWRGVFSERLDDIEGLSADFKVKQFYPVARHVGEKKYLEEATEAPGETL